jgi:hypothetical protein
VTGSRSSLTPERETRAAASLTLDEVYRELDVGWDARDYRELAHELSPYVGWIRAFLASGDELPSHIENSGSIAVPIGESTTPQALFDALGEGARFSQREYPEYWVTVHYPNPEPVVTLLPKVLPGTPRKLLELCESCSVALGAPVGGIGGMFLGWLLPGFSWAMHTDHDNLYEQIATRVHVPLITTPQSIWVWGRKDAANQEEWLLSTHLPPEKVHVVRVDVPHTVVNGHASEPRLHLILDVHEEAGRAWPYATSREH